LEKKKIRKLIYIRRKRGKTAFLGGASLFKKNLNRKKEKWWVNATRRNDKIIN